VHGKIGGSHYPEMGRRSGLASEWRDHPDEPRQVASCNVASQVLEQHPEAIADPPRFTAERFELGANVLASLHKGDAVVVVGREHTVSWGEEGNRKSGRSIDADTIAADLSRATVTVTRNARSDAD